MRTLRSRFRHIPILQRYGGFPHLPMIIQLGVGRLLTTQGSKGPQCALLRGKQGAAGQGYDKREASRARRGKVPKDGVFSNDTYEKVLLKGRC